MAQAEVQIKRASGVEGTLRITGLMVYENGIALFTPGKQRLILNKQLVRDIVTAYYKDEALGNDRKLTQGD